MVETLKQFSEARQKAPQGAMPVAAPLGATPVAAPAGATPVEPEAPGIGQRLVGRFMGTDVEEDPLEFTRMGATVVGATIGAGYGLKVPVLPGPLGVVINPVTGALAFGGVGALVGTAFPEGTMELGEAMGLLPEGTREREGLSPEDLRTVAQGEVLLELATGGGLSALRLGGRLAGRAFTGAGKAGTKAAEAGARQGVALMPVQVGNGRIARGYVAVMGRFPWIGRALTKGGQKAEEGIEAAFKEIPESMVPITGWSDISETIFKDANEFMKATSGRFGKLYEEVFARADELGVRVVPQATISKAEEILAKITSQTPTTAAQILGKAGDAATPGKALETVKDFLTEEILPLSLDKGPGGRFTAKQTLRQMDGIISKIDQRMATLDPGQRRFARSLLSQLRQAAQLDVVGNVRGMNGNEISRALKELDAEFSHTMSQVFETATAKKFGSVQRGGLRRVGFDEAMRTPVDQLARLVVKLDSPQAMNELSRLVTPETFQRITAQVFDDAITAAAKSSGGGISRFDITSFARHLGLDRASSSKRKSIAMMLDASDSPLTIKDLDELVATAETIASVEIPNVSQFLARKATIGGIQGLINGVVPGLAIAGGTTMVSRAGGTLMGLAMFLGGGKLVSSIIANPDSARALKTVLDKEASRLVKREAVVRALRLGLEAMKQQEFISDEDHDQLRGIATSVVDALDRQIQDMTGE